MNLNQKPHKMRKVISIVDGKTFDVLKGITTMHLRRVIIDLTESDTHK